MRRRACAHDARMHDCADAGEATLHSGSRACILSGAMSSLIELIEKAWQAVFGGLQRGDPSSWIVVVGILVLAALLIIRSNPHK
jgi:hypothetical protein